MTTIRCRLDISKYLLSRYEDDPGDFIDRVVTQDETWVHFDPESKMQSMQWKFKRASSAGKVMASVFWDSQEVIMIDYLQQKGTSRQRSGKGAIRKRFPLQKPRWEKTKLTIRYLYHENIT